MIFESAVRDKRSLDAMSKSNCHTEIMHAQGSNQQPLDYKSNDIPNELIGRLKETTDGLRCNTVNKIITENHL